MPEPPAPNPAGVPAGLHEAAQALRAAPIDPEGQRALARLLDELGDALAAAPAPAPETEHLVGSTAELVRALHRRHEPGALAAARDRLEGAVLGVEVKAPWAAGVARRLLEALSNLGI